jgi:hypothetical protein
MYSWIKKATTTSDDFDPVQIGAAGGFLSPQQVRQFLRLAIEASILLTECRVESSIYPKFEIPRISMNSRILHPGTQAVRVIDGNRVKPVSGLMSLSTVLFKGEVPVSDETFEDQIEQEALADTLMTMIAEAVGRDLEEIAIKSDTVRTPGIGTDPAEGADFDQLDGIIKRATTIFPAAQKINASGITTYEDLFATMVAALPARYRRNYAELRFYVPTAQKDGYQQSISARGTSLGDNALIANMTTNLAYRGIPVKDVPLMGGTDTINSVAIDYGQYAFLTPPSNIVCGFQRKVRIEKWRDPREGATSFLPTVRFDVDWANPEASIMAYNINIPTP